MILLYLERQQLDAEIEHKDTSCPAKPRLVLGKNTVVKKHDDGALEKLWGPVQRTVFVVVLCRTNPLHPQDDPENGMPRTSNIRVQFLSQNKGLHICCQCSFPVFQNPGVASLSISTKRSLYSRQASMALSCTNGTASEPLGT